jgi:hypothetical protein
VATLLVAGCLQSQPASSPAVLPSDDPDAAPDAAILPNEPRPWRVGDWWKYATSSVVQKEPSLDLTLVVAEETPTTWTLAGAETARVNFTFFTHVPALGPVRKSDFAVTRHDQFVPYLRFPLEDGATWPVESRGSWQAFATRANLTVAGATLDGWRIEYRDGTGNLQHVIEWASEPNWLVREAAHFGQPQPSHEMVLQAWGHNHTGTLRVHEAHDVHVRGHGYGPTSPSGSETFEVPTQGDGLLLGVFLGGTDGHCMHYFVGPPGSGEIRGGGGACGPIQLEWVERPLVPGTWRSVWLASAPGSFVFVEALRIDMRTVTLV